MSQGVPLGPYADRTFKDYLAIIAGIEQHEFELFRQSINSRIIGTSFWNCDVARLRRIQNEHGIEPDDPRITSIAAYRAEREQIGRQYPAHDVSTVSAELFFGGCLYARFFNGLDELIPSTVDSIPKCWRFVEHLLNVRDFGHTLPQFSTESTTRPAVTDRQVQEVYSVLHDMKLSFAPTPPYPSFTPAEARDELTRIANLLELEDQRRCAEWERKHSLLQAKEPASLEKAKGDEAAAPANFAELLIWLDQRVRWLREYNLASGPAKSISDSFREAIIRVFDSEKNAPTETNARLRWAKENIWRFAELTIHQTHSHLEKLGSLDNPPLVSSNPLTNSRCLIEAIDQLTNLRSFIARRASTLSSDANLSAPTTGNVPPLPAEPPSSTGAASGADRQEKAKGQDVAEGEAGELVCRHGPGFRSVVWNGQEFSFTGAQSKVVELLWQSLDNKTPDVPDVKLIDAAGSEATRLRDLFKLPNKAMHPAWDSMIVQGATQGTHRLQELSV